MGTSQKQDTTSMSWTWLSRGANLDVGHSTIASGIMMISRAMPADM